MATVPAIDGHAFIGLECVFPREIGVEEGERYDYQYKLQAFKVRARTSILDIKKALMKQLWENYHAILPENSYLMQHEGKTWYQDKTVLECLPPGTRPLQFFRVHMVQKKPQLSCSRCDYCYEKKMDCGKDPACVETNKKG